METCRPYAVVMETLGDSQDRAQPGADQTSAAMSKIARVLVVEDEQDIAALIKHTLERSGEMQASIVGSGDAALRAVAEHPPDVVILDLNLPVLSGTEVCRILRSRPATNTGCPGVTSSVVKILTSASNSSLHMTSGRFIAA